MERLQKVIASCGVASRRKAEQLILQGRVSVNGKTVLELGTKVGEHDQVTVDGALITKQNKVYYLLNKPRGVISSVQDEKGRKTVIDLIESDVRVYPVGRLDYDTTGVLLLTNDGTFADLLMHPHNQVDKFYIAKVDGIIKGDAICQLKKGVIIDGKEVRAHRAKVKKVDYKSNTSMVEVVIHEGLNHQVKKMFESVGFQVLKLKRERVFIFDLTGLKSGEYRKLTPKEVQRVYSLKK